MNLICKLFGHKIKKEVLTYADVHSGVPWKRWVWLSQCPRCGEKLKIKK